MKKFVLIDHIADVRLYVEGTSREELFLAALQGMNNIIKPHQCPGEFNAQMEIKISSSSLTTLLIDFLSAVLTQTYIKKKLFCSITVVNLTDTVLHAHIYGHTVEHFEEDIKAVTYHEAEVKQNDRGNYETIVVFDV